MRLLSDFDGVWTHPRLEASVQASLLDAALIRAVPEAQRDAARAWIAAARRSVLADPQHHGWAPTGRLSCFADEDPFAEHSGLLYRIHHEAPRDPLAAAIERGVQAAHGIPLEEFGGRIHTQAVHLVEDTRGPGILPEAAEAGHRMVDAGIDIVLVSNSGDDKLDRWFGSVGFKHTPHPHVAPGALRMRGHARKFQLDDARSQRLVIGALDIEVARPRYEAILREEAPDAVVGDVFSLDIALPLWLKRTEPSWQRVRLFWLTRDYAPERMRRDIVAHAPEVECVADGLPGVAQRLLG